MLKLAVYAICKNEIKNIEKWLDNIKEADYICVLDTGSTDGTYEFLQSQSNIILKQEIIQPFRFDIARNKSLELIPEDADICLPLDIDQFITSDFSMQIKAAWKPNTAKLSIPQLFKPTNSAGIWSAHSKTDVRWKYPIYEQLEVSDGLKLTCTSVIIVHDFDYMRDSHDMYLDLAELAIKENPLDPYCYQCKYKIQKEAQRRKENMK